MATLGAWVSSIRRHSLNFIKITQAHFNLLFLYNLNPVKDAALFGLVKVEPPYYGSSRTARKAQKVQVVKEDKYASSKSGHQTNYHRLLYSHNYLNYAPPVLVSLYVIIECVVILSQNGFKYSTTAMPRFFSHRFMLKAIWQIGDAVVFMALANSVYVFFSLFFDPLFSPKLVMYLFEDKEKTSSANEKGGNCSSAAAAAVIVQNGKVLKAKTSDAIARFYRKTGGTLRTSFTLIFGVCEMYVNLCMYQNQRRPDYRRTAYDNFMWVIVLLAAGYMVTAALFLPFFFCISARYVQIKQKLLRASFQKLQSKVILLIAKSTKTSNSSQQQPDIENRVACLWNKLNSFNREMASLFEEIRLYNRFWAKYITSLFLVCCLEVCYFAFIILIYSSTIPGYQTFVFSFVAIILLFFLVFLTFLCSTLVYRSARLARQAQQVAMMLAANLVVLSNFQSASSASFWHYRHLSGLFKVDQMAANYRNIESVSAFRLSVGYEINSKMFQMLFTYTSLYFMMILGGYYKNSSGEVANSI